MRFILHGLVSRTSLIGLRYSFFFLSSPLIWLCPLPIFPSPCKFPFSRAFWFFYYLAVPFLLLSSFPTLYYEHGPLFNTESHSYILSVYSYFFIFKSPILFSSFCKQLDGVPVHSMINIYRQFSKFVHVELIFAAILFFVAFLLFFSYSFSFFLFKLCSDIQWNWSFSPLESMLPFKFGRQVIDWLVFAFVVVSIFDRRYVTPYVSQSGIF